MLENIEGLCVPALIYLIYGATRVIIDTYKGMYNLAFMQIWITILFTYLLNVLCRGGLGIISWIIIAIPFLLMASTVNAVLPDLLCQELKAALVDPVTLRTNEITELRTLYRFNSSSLFLSSHDRSEYLYNKVQQLEQRRFSSGHKTFIFDETFRRGLQVHIYVDEVRISQMSCNELKR